MTESRNPKVTFKMMLFVILAAAVTAVVITLLQALILGRSNVAVTGGVVGAMVAVLAFMTMKASS